jgi:hypothetical protein
MAGSLIVPQVQVKWGSRNLSAYVLDGSKESQTIVFNVEVDFQESGWPTGSFLWNPSGPAFKVYEDCVKNGQNDPIKIRFYYVNGPYILMEFQYNGSEITYGNDMSVKVKLVSGNAPKSSAVRSTAMQDYTGGKFSSKGIAGLEALYDMHKSFGDPIPFKFSETSKEDMKKVFIASWQFKDQTYGAITQNFASQVGDRISLTNIGGPGQASQFSPLSWEGKQKKDSVKFPPGPGETPKGEQRYGYILGPGIIQNFTRSMEYPSQTQGVGSDTQPSNTPNKDTPAKPPGSQPLKGPEDQSKAQKAAQKRSVTNPSSPSTVKGNKFTKNDIGPEKQQFQQQEDSITLSTNMFMCPALVGIKPQDVIYIPSLKIGDALMEDYRVKTVSYVQDGAQITVNVSACRTAGLNHLMNDTAGKKFQEKADTLKTEQDWLNYAWKERMGK